ncbi:hypothetical protein V8C42DRAFT_307336 [Trichoderma barbatum]
MAASLVLVLVAPSQNSLAKNPVPFSPCPQWRWSASLVVADSLAFWRGGLGQMGNLFAAQDWVCASAMTKIAGSVLVYMKYYQALWLLVMEVLAS